MRFPQARAADSRRWQRTLAGLLLAGLAGSAAAQAPLRVLYPAAESAYDARQDYPRKVLELALAHAGRPYVLRGSTVPANQKRALRMLATGNGIDVVWTVPTAVRERELRTIPFAIDRGLIGWRVLLVRAGTEQRFAGIDDARGLRAMRGAQGQDWPDLEILRAAGLGVDGAHTYDGLFAMLARGRIDYFPRSVMEIGDELARRPGQGLAIEPRLLLRYPSALQFFVRRDNTALAGAIALGLARAEADGSLDRLFHATYDEVLAPLRLDSRTTIALRNPLWSASRGKP